VQKLKLHRPVIRSLRLSLLWLIFLTLLAVAQPVLAEPVKIMPFGVWTEGIRHRATYRYDLWFNLIDAGFDVDFVGSKTNTSDGPRLDWYPKYLTEFDRDHQGYGSTFASDLVGSAQIVSARHQPDIVLLWLGAYDLYQPGGGSVKLAIPEIIENFRSEVPGVTILLGLTHYVPALKEAHVDALNNVITTIASELDTPQSPIILVDHYTGFDVGSMMMGDGVHHNRVGEARVAQNWFEVLADILPDFEPEPFQINTGHAGAWFNPETPGQGQLIDVEPESKFLFLSWFTFTDAASADPNEQHWFTAQGNYSGDSADLIVYETLGGRFDDPKEVSTDPVGVASLSFADCSLGQMSYSIETWDVEGSFPMQRAIPGTENVCQELAGLNTEPLDENDGWDGAWYDEETPGQGFLIDAHPNPEGDDFIFVAWFTYGDGTASGQRWLTAQGPLVGTAADLVVYETTGGSFDAPITDETNPVGTITIDFTDCSHALLTYMLTDEGLEESIQIQRTIPGTDALCQELNG